MGAKIIAKTGRSAAKHKVTNNNPVNLIFKFDRSKETEL